MATKKLIREYPDTWDHWKVYDFVRTCIRVNGIPKGHTLKVKHHKRRGTKSLIFTWKV